MTGSIRFPVTLDGIRDARQLQQQRVVFLFASGLAMAGIIFLLLGQVGGIGFLVLGALLLVAWRFPVFDRLFDRRRMAVGSDCEVWLDDSGLRWHQTREGSFDTSGHFEWSRIGELLENDRAMLVMDGRVVLVGIPKADVDSAEQLEAFRDEVRRRISDRRRASPNG